MIFFFLVKVLHRYVIISTWWGCGKFLCLNAKGKPGKKKKKIQSDCQNGEGSFGFSISVFSNQVQALFWKIKPIWGRRLQTELSREMLSCYEGWCECPVCLVWMYLDRKKWWSYLILVPAEASQNIGTVLSFSLRTLAKVWVKMLSIQRWLQGNGEYPKFNWFGYLRFLQRKERKRALFCFNNQIAELTCKKSISKHWSVTEIHILSLMNLHTSFGIKHDLTYFNINISSLYSKYTQSPLHTATFIYEHWVQNKRTRII